MNLDGAIKYISENNGAVYAYDEKNLEIFFIDYENDPERFSPIIVYYSKYSGTDHLDRFEDIFPVEEYFDMFPNASRYNYIPIGKDALGYMNDDYEEVIRYFEANKTS
jgi:hypothetical protein